MSIADKLVALRTSVKGISNALQEHGADMTDVPLREYGQLIDDLKGGGEFRVGKIALNKLGKNNPEWIPADGSNVRVEDYPTLAAIIGEVVEEGDYDFTTLPVRIDIPQNTSRCSFSPNGRWLAIAHRDSPYMTIIDVFTWEDIPNTPSMGDYDIRDMGWSPDNRHLAVVHSNSPFLTVISTYTWTKVPNIPLVSGTVCLGCSFSPDGRYLAIGRMDSDGLVVLNTSDWSRVPNIPTLPNYRHGRKCRWSPDGKWLVVPFWEEPYYSVIDTTDWTILPDTPTIVGDSEFCSFSPDGRYLAINHTDYNSISPSFTVIDVDAWSKVPNIPFLYMVNDAEWTTDNRYLIVSSYQGIVVMDVDTWSITTLTDTVFSNNSLSPDNKYLLAVWGGNTPKDPLLFPLKVDKPQGYFKLPYEPPRQIGDRLVQPMVKVGPPPPKLIYNFTVSPISNTPILPGIGEGVSFSPNGKWLAVAYRDGTGLMVLNSSTMVPVANIPNLPDSYAVDWSPDSKWLAVGSSPWLTVIDTTTWTTMSNVPKLIGTIAGVSFSKDGAHLAVVHGVSPYLTIMSTATWTVVSGTPTLPGSGKGVVWSIDNTHLAVAHDGGSRLTIIKTSNWSIVPNTLTLPDDGRSVSFSSDGKYLAVGHNGSPRLTVLNTKDWTKVPNTPIVVGTGECVVFTPDSKYLVVAHYGGNRLAVVDTTTWTVVPGTPTLPSTGEGVSFSPDGTKLAIAHYGSPYLTIIPVGTWTK